MKILRKAIDKNLKGSVKVLVESEDDLWHLYHLVAPGDNALSVTQRKIATETGSGNSVERMKAVLKIRVERADYDSSCGKLRISGPVVNENSYTKLGAYHTLEITINKNFTLEKEHWDSIYFSRLNEACDVTARADVGAVLLGEHSAYLCVVTSARATILSKLFTSLPNKKFSQKREKVTEKFFEDVYRHMIKQFDFDALRAIVIASPEFIKDQFYSFMMEMAVKQGDKILQKNKQKIILIHIASSHTIALSEVFKDPQVRELISDAKATTETKILQEFYDILNKDDTKAIYGEEYVELANDAKAIATLLLSDDLFKHVNNTVREKYVRLVEQVKRNGGKVHIFSSQLPSELNQLTGIAAILRYPMPNLEEAVEERKAERTEKAEKESEIPESDLLPLIPLTQYSGIPDSKIIIKTNEITTQKDLLDIVRSTPGIDTKDQLQGARTLGQTKQQQQQPHEQTATNGSGKQKQNGKQAAQQQKQQKQQKQKLSYLQEDDDYGNDYDDYDDDYGEDYDDYDEIDEDY